MKADCPPDYESLFKLFPQGPKPLPTTPNATGRGSRQKGTRTLPISAKGALGEEGHLGRNSGSPRPSVAGQCPGIYLEASGPPAHLPGRAPSQDLLGIRNECS